MTIIGGKDRCDYRAMDIKELIEESIYNPNTELCIVLGERASLMDHKLTLSRRETDDLRHVLSLANSAKVIMDAELRAYREEARG